MADKKNKQVKKNKIIKKQEDYATMADRGLVANILGFSPMGEISRGISNLISDDEKELKKIRTQSSKKATSELDTGFKGIPAPYQPSDLEKKSGGGAVRGVGKAQRGFGRATYSDKLI